MVGTKHFLTEKACKTPEYQLITGYQYVRLLLLPIFSKYVFVLLIYTLSTK